MCVCRRKPAPEGERVYRATIRAMAVLSLVLAGVTSARANARVVVDLPAANSTLPPSFIIGGWMLDFNATRDPGVSGLHVWAYPASGAGAIFIGEITRGPRPDVAGYYGSQFLQSGYSIIVRNLPPGRYFMVLTPWSSVTNGFDYAAAVYFPVTISTTATPIPTPPVSNPEPPAPPPTPAPTPIPDPTPTPTPSGQELRVLEWNTHHGGYGTDGIYSPDRITTWAARMNPDVIRFI